MFKIAALVASAAAAATPGASVSLTEQGMNNAKNVAVPYIFNIIKDIKLPEVKFDGGYLKNIDINLPQPPISALNINTDHANNGVELVANQVTAHLQADFSYSYFITVTGSADVKVNKLGLDMEIDVSEQPGTPSSEMAPKLKVQKSTININPDDIDITLSGSLVAKIASVFIPLFKSTVIPMVVKEVQSQITTVVNTQINQDLVVYGNEINVPYIFGMTADYSQVNGGVTITSDNIAEMSILGKFFYPGAKSTVPAPVKFPVHDPKGKTLQGFLSEYTVNTFAEAAFLSGQTLDVAAIVAKFNNTKVTTTDFKYVIPELAAKYGEGVEVKIAAKVLHKAPKVTFSSKTNSVVGYLAFTLTVNGETAVHAEFDGINAAGQVNTKQNKLYGDFTTAVIGNIDAASFKSSVSGMTAASLQAEIQKEVDGYVAQLNALLHAGIAYPTLFDISISGLDANCHEGYISGGIDVTPAAFEMFRDFMNSVAEEMKYIRRLNRIEEINKAYYAARANVVM